MPLHKGAALIAASLSVPRVRLSHCHLLRRPCSQPRRPFAGGCANLLLGPRIPTTYVAAVGSLVLSAAHSEFQKENTSRTPYVCTTAISWRFTRLALQCKINSLAQKSSQGVVYQVQDYNSKFFCLTLAITNCRNVTAIGA